MAGQSLRLGGHARLVWVIAVKDVIEALTNRTILAIAFGTLMTVLIGQAFPLILQLSGTRMIAIYEADGAAITDSLRSMEGVRVIPARTPEMVLEIVREAAGPMLGIVLPAGTPEAASAGDFVVEGYLPSWIGPAEARGMVSFFEQRLADGFGGPVSIHTDGNRVAPTAESGGRPGMAAIVVVTVVVCLGMFLIPYLLTEEREQHTIDVLLVSPASTAHIVTGKMAAGVLLGGVAGAIALAVNARLVIHWPLAILAVACGVVFMASLGLLMGSLFESMSSMSPVVLVLVLLLLMPLVFAANILDKWPEIIRQVIDWVPSVSMGHVLRMSLTPEIDAGIVAGRLGSIVALSAVLLALTAMRVRASDR
jgi:hypothetical protein